MLGLIKALSRANVKDELIISQINASRTAYRLGAAQIIDLKDSGVSEKVIDHMINTPTTRAQQQTTPVYEYHYAAPAWHPYYYYWGPTYPYRLHHSRGRGRRRH